MTDTAADFMKRLMERYNPHMSANADNPLPYKQPFLVLTLKGEKSKALNCSDHGVVHIDVDGQIEKYITKGKEVAVEGKLITRNYNDKEGNKKYVTEIQVNELLMLGSKDAD